jgi:hypothetical protein
MSTFDVVALYIIGGMALAFLPWIGYKIYHIDK